ncbi:MAG: GYD domain-containing protein [Candidatus Promineifilaceae bacterium]
MPTYVTLYNFTQQGIQNIKDGPARLEAAKAAVEAAGGRIVGFYLTMGRFDIVVISEGPDDMTAATVTLAIAAEGNVRSETLRAFTEEEYRQIVDALP